MTCITLCWKGTEKIRSWMNWKGKIYKVRIPGSRPVMWSYILTHSRLSTGNLCQLWILRKGDLNFCIHGACYSNFPMLPVCTIHALFWINNKLIQNDKTALSLCPRNSKIKKKKYVYDTDISRRATLTLSGALLRWVATWVKAVSMIALACGTPKPLKAVHEGMLVLHRRAAARRFGMQ